MQHTELPEKIEPTTPNFQAELAEKIAEIAPEVLSDGKLDVAKLRELVNGDAETSHEKFGLFWPGKRAAQAIAQIPTTATLVPALDEGEDWGNTNNLVIEGDNLEVLKTLQNSYRRKVKMIYIDPPYNTGKEFVYPDKFSEGLQGYLDYTGQRNEVGENLESKQETGGRRHSNWLSMMYPRLQLAKSLLTDDGVILISIDDNEQPDLRLLCDEVFGEDNFAGQIIWKNSSKNDQKYVSVQHEYFIAYVRNKAANSGDWIEQKEGLKEIYTKFDELKRKYGKDYRTIHQAAIKWFGTFSESNPIRSSKHYSWMDDRGVYFPADISGPNFGQYRYDVLHPVTGKVCKEPASGWRYPEATMKQRMADGLIHFGEDENTIPNNKTYLKDTESQSLTSIKYRDGRVATNNLRKLMDGDVFTNPKNTDVLESFFKAIGVKNNDIVMDFFAGSGSTAEAVMKLNLHNDWNVSFINVQLPEKTYKTDKDGNRKYLKESKVAFQLGYMTIADITKERIRRAGRKIQKEDANIIAQRSTPLDTGFRVYKLTSSNFVQWDENKAKDDIQQAVLDFAVNKKPEAAPESLLAEIMLQSRIQLSAHIERRDLQSGGWVYVVDDGNLIAYVANEQITESEVNEIADLSPAKLVILDSAFNGNNALKINVMNICKEKFIKEFKTI